jgi:hypothetical protein
MVKNEGLLLDKVLPIWKEYPVNKFVFYNDNSTDDTVDVIQYHLEKNRFEIVNDRLERFHEARQRSRMLTCSRQDGADYVLSIDADELLSSNLVEDFEDVIKTYEKIDTWLYWYNVVNGSLEYTRNDPFYQNSYRSFILPLKYTGDFDLNLWKYHTPRVPEVNLEKRLTKDYGVIHLQAINKEFYALKQLWYKHHEFIEYGHTPQQINQKYDPVVNGLDFMESNTPQEIINNLNFDASIFDEILKQKNYREYIEKNLNKDLLTFGKKYISEKKIVANNINKLYIHHHLGLGDHICMSGLVRYLSKKEEYDRIFVCCKDKYINLLKPLYADTEKIQLLPVTSNAEEELLDVNRKTKDGHLMRIGFSSYNETKGISCDEAFYRLAKVPYNARFNEFFFERDLQEEQRVYKKLNPNDEEFIFVHDDPDRGHILPIRSPYKIIRNDITENLFHYGKILENAKEIHCIESVFRCLIEFYNVENTELFIHSYLRNTPGDAYGTRKEWKILK